MSNPPTLSDEKRVAASRIAPVLLCVLLIIGGGIAHGYLDSRWTNQEETRALAEPLLNLQQKVGNWELVSSDELEGSAKRILQCYGSLVRTYVNKTTGDRIP